jgi:hypothetical protein
MKLNYLKEMKVTFWFRTSCLGARLLWGIYDWRNGMPLFPDLLNHGNSCLFFFFFQYWSLNSGLTLARQALYHLSHPTSLIVVRIRGTLPFVGQSRRQSANPATSAWTWSWVWTCRNLHHLVDTLFYSNLRWGVVSQNSHPSGSKTVFITTDTCVHTFLP